jgi:hypothetical protein
VPDEPNDTPTPKKDDEGKTFTQADIDRIVADRLSREKNKYSDYDELKAKADKFDEKEAANKSEADRLRDENAKLQKERDENAAKALRLEVAGEKGIKSKYVTGSSREEMEAAADEYLEDHPPTDGAKPPPSNKPTPDLKGGSDPSEEAAETDPAKLAANVPRF